jgi:hypothetical protein
MGSVLDYFKVLWRLARDKPFLDHSPMSYPTFALPSGDTTIQGWRRDFVLLNASSLACNRLQTKDAQAAQKLNSRPYLLQLYKAIRVVKIEYRST